MTLKMDIKTLTVMDNTSDSAYSSDNNNSNYAKPHLKNYIDTYRGHNTDTDLSSKVLSLINELQIYRQKQELNELTICQQGQEIQKLMAYQQKQEMNEHKICQQGQEIQELRALLMKTLPITANNVKTDDKVTISDNILTDICPNAPADNDKPVIGTEKQINLNSWENIYDYQQLCHKTSPWFVPSNIPELNAENVRLANGQGYEFVQNYFNDIEKSVSRKLHILQEIILSK